MGPVEVYRTTRKRPDLFWNTFVARPPAAVVVALLAKTPVTPNQITLSAFVVAFVASAMVVLLPGYLGLLAAIVVFELSYVLDCADGMLARLRGIASAKGHLLDFLMDEIKAFVLLAAVAARLFLESNDTRYLLLGLVGLVCLATGIAITTFQRRPEIAGPPPEKKPDAKPPAFTVLSLPMALLKWLIHYPSYILYAAIAGHIEWYFFVYIAVNALYALKSLAWLALRFGRFEARA
jgi:phosphatidylglycerophosphate synthase